MRPSTLEEVQAIADRMMASPADAVALARQLQDAIGRLPPPRSDLMTRPSFERAALFSLAALFELVQTEGEAPLAVIRAPSDLWVRGVSCQAYPQFVLEGEQGLSALIELESMWRELAATMGTNHRGLVEVNWRLNGRQGFVSTGASGEILAPASVVTGDGFWSAPLDWRLQRNETIEVRLRSRLLEIFNGTGFGFLPADDFATMMTLRYAVVSFWVEEIQQPSIPR